MLRDWFGTNDPHLLWLLCPMCFWYMCFGSCSVDGLIGATNKLNRAFRHLSSFLPSWVARACTVLLLCGLLLSCVHLWIVPALSRHSLQAVALSACVIGYGAGVTALVGVWRLKSVDPGVVVPGGQWEGSVGQGVARCEHCPARPLKPAAAHHCRVCGHCVAQHCHHCFILNRCIGVNNRGLFVVTLLGGAVALDVLAAFSIVAASLEYPELEKMPIEKQGQLCLVYGLAILTFSPLACVISCFAILNSLLFVTGQTYKDWLKRSGTCAGYCAKVLDTSHKIGPAADASSLQRLSCSLMLGLAEVCYALWAISPARPRTAAAICLVAAAGSVLITHMIVVSPDPGFLLPAQEGMPSPARPLAVFCKECQLQVLGRDHHCHLFGVCIGQKNRRRYLLVLSLSIVGNCVLCPCAFTHCGVLLSASRVDMSTLAVVIAALLLSSGLLLFSAFYAMQQVVYLCIVHFRIHGHGFIPRMLGVRTTELESHTGLKPLHVNLLECLFCVWPVDSTSVSHEEQELLFDVS